MKCGRGMLLLVTHSCWMWRSCRRVSSTRLRSESHRRSTMPDVGRQRQHGLIEVHILRLPLHDAAHDEGVTIIPRAE